jgi:hypothetical protein
MNPRNASASRKYTIQNEDGYDWQVGQSGTGCQVIIGTYDGSIVAVFFDVYGDLQRVESRPTTTSLDSRSETRNRRSELDAWKAEIGFEHSKIRIGPFSVPNLLIRINDLPEFLREFLDNPSFVKDAQERSEWFADVERWHAEGRFVFQWGKEYWVNNRGEVTDT